MNGFLRPAIASLLEKASGGKQIPGMEPLYNGLKSAGRRYTMAKGGAAVKNKWNAGNRDRIRFVVSQEETDRIQRERAGV